MKKTFTIGLLLIAACSSKPVTQSEESRKDLDKTWKARIGSTTKTDMVEEFGNAEWCTQDEAGATETCRFLRKKGVKWVGEKNDTDKKRVDQFDQVIGTFDRQGILRDIETKVQR